MSGLPSVLCTYIYICIYTLCAYAYIVVHNCINMSLHMGTCVRTGGKVWGFGCLGSREFGSHGLIPGTQCYGKGSAHYLKIKGLLGGTPRRDP